MIEVKKVPGEPPVYHCPLCAGDLFKVESADDVYFGCRGCGSLFPHDVLSTMIRSCEHMTWLCQQEL